MLHVKELSRMHNRDTHLYVCAHMHISIDVCPCAKYMTLCKTAYAKFAYIGAALYFKKFKSQNNGMEWGKNHINFLKRSRNYLWVNLEYF